MFSLKRGTTIISRDGKEKGKATGGARACQLEGCPGSRIGVRWPDGKITWPCSEGLISKGNNYKIR